MVTRNAKVPVGQPALSYEAASETMGERRDGGATLLDWNLADDLAEIALEEAYDDLGWR